MKYIHYGSNKFDKNLYVPIKNNIEFPIKPIGGFWSSKIDSNYGWYQYCKDNDFHIERLNKSFVFNIKKDSNILVINNGKDLLSLPYYYKDFKYLYKIDFEKMFEDKIDVLEINISADLNSKYFERLYWLMYGWDCDTVLILNPDIIIEEL